MVFALGGCSSSPKDENNNSATQPAELEGTIQIAGSTSVQPLSEELAKAFMTVNPQVKINVAGGGSGAGVKAAQSGTADIGAASRELENEEKPTVKYLAIAMDGIAVIVHKDNRIEDLTLENIAKIFTGEITDWSDLGGEKGTIHVFNREEGSGTRGAFEDIVIGDSAFTDKAGIQNSTGAVRTAVAGDISGIGYISLGGLNDEIKALKVEGVEATLSNVQSGKYKISRPFNYMTQHEPEGLTKAYIDYVLSAEGQAIVKENGFIPIK
jgi:phosphate transport system substrate-binding protein